jgi:hypothetical protein
MMVVFSRESSVDGFYCCSTTLQVGFYGHFVAAGPDRSHSRIGVRPRGAPFIKESVYYAVSKKKMGIRNHEFFSSLFLSRFLLDLHMRHYVHAAAHFVTSVTIDTGKATSLLFICNQLS